MAPTPLFSRHPRQWRSNRYVYPVISRRSRGLSIGVNLNPAKDCNFGCVYCSVDRTVPPAVREVDLAVLREELDGMLGLAASGELFAEEPFDQTPPGLRRLNDVAFSGDGEPTASPFFPEACRLAVEVMATHGLAEGETPVKVVVITNATLFHRPEVAAALAFLDQHHGEIWAKLDAGADEYFRRVNRCRMPLQRILDNLLAVGRLRPIVIQSLFLRLAGASPTEDEIAAYLDRLRELMSGGCRIALIQVYTTARSTADTAASPLDHRQLNAIADRVRALGLTAEVFPGLA
jgi:wyosine [tRNA(Phe)-imidazoG37] synthetase (radical SAM superfamily)